MTMRLQVCMYFAIGIIAYHGVDSYICQAEARGFAAAIPIMTLEQLQEIPVIKTRNL